MGQKVNPHGLRIGIIKDWDSKWYDEEPCAGDYACEDGFLRSRFGTKDWDSYFEKISVKVQNFAVCQGHDCRKMKKMILFALNHIWHRTKRHIVVVV